MSDLDARILTTEAITKKTQILTSKLGIIERRISDGIAEGVARRDRDVSVLLVRESVYQFSAGREWSLDSADFGDLVRSSCACFVDMVPVGFSLRSAPMIFCVRFLLFRSFDASLAFATFICSASLSLFTLLRS